MKAWMRGCDLYIKCFELARSIRAEIDVYAGKENCLLVKSACSYHEVLSSIRHLFIAASMLQEFVCPSKPPQEPPAQISFPPSHPFLTPPHSPLPHPQPHT